jgi:hypothetical protein
VNFLAYALGSRCGAPLASPSIVIVGTLMFGAAAKVARLHSAPIAVYAVAVLLAPWLTAASIVLFAAVPAFFIMPNPFLERRLAELGGMTR